MALPCGGLGLGARPAAAEALAWTRLRFEASKALILRGSVDVRATRLAAGDVALVECAESPGLPVGEAGAVLLEGTSDSTVSAPAQSRTILDAITFGVLQTEEGRPGRRLKTRRFTVDGDHQWRRKPEGRAERRGDPESWQAYRDQHEPWPVGAPRDLPVTEGHALLYQAAAARLDREGAALDVLLWTHGRLVRLALRAREIETIDARFQRRTADGWTRVAGPVSVRRVSIDVEPLSPEGLPEDLDVLGMKRGVAILVEVGTGLPVEIHGDVPPVGHVAVRLVEAE